MESENKGCGNNGDGDSEGIQEESPRTSTESLDLYLSVTSNDTSVEETNVQVQSPYNNNGRDKIVSESTKEDNNDTPLLPSVPYYKLFRFATKMDKFKIFIGCLLSILTGLCAPITNYAFGLFTKAMVDKASNMSECSPSYYHSNINNNPTTSSSTLFSSSSINASTIYESNFSSPFMRSVETFVLYNCACGVFQFLSSYIMVVCFNIVAENQAHKLRLKYFESVLRQEIGWFDTHRKKDFATLITDDILKIQEAMSEKLGMCIFSASNFILLVTQSYYYGWKLSTLLTFAFVPIFLVTYFQTTWSNSLTTKEQDAYSTVATVAQEAISNIRTVTAFNGQEKELERYDYHLRLAKRFSFKKGALLGLGHGLGWLCCFLNYALAFWYGTQLIIESRERGDNLYGPDTIVVVFFGILVASFNVGPASEYFESFGVGTGSASAIFPIIDRISEIDAFSLDGVKPNSRAKGNVEFCNVHFSYPSRPEVQVLSGLNLKIQPGQTIALVGQSGAGKTTCIQLLQRFYNILSGEIKLDGLSIDKLNLKWLRSQIGVVSQEPILFNMSIMENIKLGKHDATNEEVEMAAKMAFAHDFIMKLPKGYSTLTGERGTQLSGGQKQRIAIARALVRNPPILLLDEATSALDMYSEALVQAALESARHGRTTIIVAHRLSTIKAADIIIVLDKGAVAEVGSHFELMRKKEIYYNLVQDQGSIENNCLETTLLSKTEVEFLSANEDPYGLLPPLPSQLTSLVEIKCSSHNSNYITRCGDDEEKIERKKLMMHFKLSRMIKMGFQEWPYLLASALCTMIKGLNVPIYSIVFGNFIAIFASYDDQYILDQGNYYSLLYLIIALVTGFSAFFQRYFAVLASDKFTLRLRRLLFKTVLRQDISFFDEQENTVGRLCARLSTDAASMQGAIGNRLIGLVQAVTIISLSVAMSFYYIPKMCAVLCLFIPLSIASTMTEGKILEGANITEKKAVENAVNIAVEALDNIRTVQSLGVESIFIELFKKSLVESHKINVRRAHIRALAYAFVYSLPYVAYSVSLFYGAYLVEQECVHISDVFKVAEALIFGSMASGTALAYAPDYSKGKISAARIFKLFDRKPTIDACGPHGRILTHPQGKVEFDRVGFTYPLRPQVKALQNVCILVHPGDKIGLVGQTGSGKSTFVQLLLHFYDAETGKITFDDEDLKILNTKDLRSHLALVSQEPILFDRSISENIAYGDNSREYSMDEIISVARMANIHDFIVSLPGGYSTRVGSLGSQLSGGQKQRVSIARALLRNSKVLILDEATSALDANSEKIVQDALDKAQDGRTSITIAHRLTSIQNCSHIFVLKDGKLVEHGTHEQLLSNCNQYYTMWYAQYKRKHKNET